MLRTLILALGALAITVIADCDRDMLKNATAAYVAAQNKGDASGLIALTANLTYKENNVTVDVSNGILITPLKFDNNRSTHDPTLCATFTELIAASNPRPYVIGTRMVFTGTKISLIESIVTKPGDWGFNGTGYVYWNSQEDWSPIPPAQQDTYEVVKAGGDAYFNRFDNVSYQVPWDTPCERLEGGAYTGTGNLSANTCDLGLPGSIVVTDRRYVVDVEAGTVDIFCGFPGLDRSQGNAPAPDSHFFRIVGGKIRYIHTVSSCVEAGCGLNGSFGAPPAAPSPALV